jgi:2-polyprenyl-3-methyl-5-hydroxy-6-metoxy-1,4-benzoquinol methylase
LTPDQRSRRGREVISAVVASYDDRITRLYAWIRFKILRQPFLEELDQYLPSKGRILDLGCGFGLFSLYFGSLEPERELVGLDLNPRRVARATRSAQKLGLDNVEYRVQNAVEVSRRERFDAIYALDLMHHLPVTRVSEVLAELRRMVEDDGLLLVKEVEDRPWHKRWFTLILDRLMVGMEPIHYWSRNDLMLLLQQHGFEVRSHRMIDILPYPHILYVCRPAPDEPGRDSWSGPRTADGRESDVPV